MQVWDPDENILWIFVVDDSDSDESDSDSDTAVSEETSGGSAQHDWIFENSATVFLVAKIRTEWFIHIWVVWRPTELKFGI